MKKQLVIIGVLPILVCAGLSGCNQIYNSGFNIILINHCDKEIHVNLTIFGGAIDQELFILSQINKTEDVYIVAGGKESVHIDNLMLEFDDQSSVSVWWNLQVNSSLGHLSLYTLQETDNATSPSILQNDTITLTFHQDGNITKED